MKPAHLLWLAVIAGLLVLLAPRGYEWAHKLAHEPGRAVPGHREATAPAAPTIALLGEDTVLKRQPNGHFYADAAVNGTPVHFLVDTGASVVALTGEDASNLGLEWNDDDLRDVARGASGPVSGVPVTLDEVSLGGIRGEHVKAVIVPRGLPVSLLGQSFLSRVPRLDIAGDKLTLGDAE